MRPAPWVLFLTQLAIMLPLLSGCVVVGLTALAWSRSGDWRAAITPLVGGVAGFFIGYFAGAFVACQWLWPASNMCGIGAVFVSAPITAIAGAWIGWRIVRRQ